MSEDKASRFAELIGELTGAKFAADLLQQVWASASDEVKRDLADAVLARFKKGLEDQASWTVREVISEHIKEEFRSVAQSQFKADDLRRQVEEQLALVQADEVKRIVREAIDQAVRQVQEEVHLRVEMKRKGAGSW